MTTRTVAQPTASRPRMWLGVGAAMFAIAWGGNEFTPLLVMYKLRHDLPSTTVDILLFAYVLGIVPALLIGGPLSDRFGRVALMRPAPLVAAAGSLVIGLGAQHVSLLFAGRVLSGIALGLAMAVGSAWIKELSIGQPDGVGARRSAMSLTAGFGIGAGVAGVLAQWGPLPDTLPYLVNLVLCVAGFMALRGIPETRIGDRSGRLVDDLKIPAVAHRRFVCVVLPVAPWVFGAAACAYAVLPTLMSTKVSGGPISFSALICVVALGCGFGIQSLGRRIDTPSGARSSVCALVIIVAGMLAAAVAAQYLTVPLTVLAAIVLGAGYGLALVAGLTEIQRIARPDDLAGLTAVFYSVTYLGFATPATMSYIHNAAGISYPTMFIAGAVASTLCLLIVGANYRSKTSAHVQNPSAPSSIEHQ